MKNILFIYNIIFLFLGSSLFANIHILHHHNHEHEHGFEIVECEECIAFESSKNYVLDSDDINSINSDISLFVYEFSNIILCNTLEIFLSRAPPISE